jgi:hypothetical protein
LYGARSKSALALSQRAFAAFSGTNANGPN